MANNLSLTVGVNTVTIPLAGTNGKINSAIKRFVEYKGVDTTALTATEIGEAALLALKKIVADTSKDRQRAESHAATDLANEAAIESDNAL